MKARQVALRELLDVTHGYAFKGEYFGDSGTDLVLTPGNFRIGGGLQMRPGKERYYHGSYSPEFLLEPDDLLVAMTDLTQGAPILGSPIRIPSSGRYLHNQRLGKILIRDPDILRPDYAYYLFVWDGVRAQIRGSATGATVRHTAPERIRGVVVPLPSVEVQDKVVGILSAYDNLIEKNAHRIELLEEMGTRIYREWFVDFRYPGHEGEREYASESEPLPDGWTTVRLGDVARLQNATVSPGRQSEEVFQHFSIPAYDNGRLPAYDLGKNILSNKFVLNGPSVLYSKLNPRIRRVWWADPDPSRRAVASTELLAFEPCGGWNRSMLYATLRSDSFRDRIVGMAGGTSTSHQRVKPTDLCSVNVVSPPRLIVEAFGSLTEPLWSLVNNLRNQAAVLSRCRDALVPRLLSGEVDVEDMDIDRGAAA